MRRSLTSVARVLLQRSTQTCGSLAPAAAEAGAPGGGLLLSLRVPFSTAAAQGGSRVQGLVHQLPPMAAMGTAAAGAAAARTATAGAAWRGLAAAAAMRQQSRGFARFLQFQPRGGGGSWGGGGWGGMSRLDPDTVLYGLIGINLAGFMAWRAWPQAVSRALLFFHSSAVLAAAAISCSRMQACPCLDCLPAETPGSQRLLGFAEQPCRSGIIPARLCALSLHCCSSPCCPWQHYLTPCLPTPSHTTAR